MLKFVPETGLSGLLCTAPHPVIIGLMLCCLCIFIFQFTIPLLRDEGTTQDLVLMPYLSSTFWDPRECGKGRALYDLCRACDPTQCHDHFSKKPIRVESILPPVSNCSRIHPCTTSATQICRTCSASQDDEAATTCPMMESGTQTSRTQGATIFRQQAEFNTDTVL